MTSTGPDGWIHRQTTFSGDFLRLEYSGPRLFVGPAPLARVVVAFAPFDYPFETTKGGWGAASFTKRGIAHVCVFHKNEDWYQNAEFFDAMKACRMFLGPDVEVATYGFSMGAYGAILSAYALDAKRAVAISPQFSIDPAVVPFERRYTEQWNALNNWQHEMFRHRRSQDRTIIICFDPLHRLDRKQAALFPEYAGDRRFLMHGAGHAGIQTMSEMGMIETLFDTLTGNASQQELRQAYRRNRRKSFRYLRKVGMLLHERRHPLAVKFRDWAQQNGLRRLIKKWRDYYA